jgi:DNA invertase Pin-like site-specific DNA recombinase
MTKRVVFYLRYSDPRQAKRGGVSLATQLQALRRVAEESGEEVVAELIDQAKSGGDMRRREAFQQMLQYAREGAMDLVRAEAIDRTNRNELDRRVMEQELSRYGVELLYLGERADAPPEQLVLTRGVQGTVAEYEKLQTSQRVYSRMKFRAEQGKWRGGRPNYGLKPDGNGWFEPDPETYPVLLHILGRLAEGWGRHRVCKELNRGISLNGEPPRIPPTPYQIEYRERPYVERMDKETGDIVLEDKPEPSPFWGTSTIQLLFNEAVEGVYAGIYRWGRVSVKLKRDKEGRPKETVVYQHPPLIPDELIARLADLKAKAPTRKGGRVTTYLLHPVCDLCGGPMHGGSYTYKGRVKRYYVCSRGRSHTGGPCRYWSAAGDLVEDAVIRKVVEQFSDLNPGELKRQLEEAAALEIARMEAAIETLTLRVEEGKRLKEDTLRYLISYGTTIGAELRREMEERVTAAIQELDAHQADLATVQAALETLRSTPVALDLSSLETVKRAMDERDHVSYDPLRRALDLLVEEVRLRPAEGRPRQKRAAQVDVFVTLRPAEEALRRGRR